MAFIKTPEAAAYCGLSKSTFEKLRMSGDGPMYFKIGRLVNYRKDDLDAWLSANRRISTKDDAQQSSHRKDA